jgi:hypothetical protein
MELTALMNSRPTPDIDSQNIVRGDAWNRQKHYVNANAEVVGENWVTVEREIIIENWVADDAWNRQRKLIHGGRMKSVEKIESSLTHGIDSENRFPTDQKSSAKTEWL